MLKKMKKQDQGGEVTDIRPQNSSALDWQRVAQEKKALGPMKALKDKSEFLKVRLLRSHTICLLIIATRD